MMFRGIVLEGITGTGKSTLFRALQDSDLVFGADSKLLLSQCYTLRISPPEHGEQLLGDILSHIEALKRYYAGSEFSARSDGRGSFCFVLEGFQYYMALEHISVLRRRAFVRAFDARLAGLGATLVALTVREDAIAENCVRSTLRHRGSGWKEYLNRIGSTEEAIVDQFRQRQTEFLALREGASMPQILLDTTEHDWTRALQVIVKSIGGGEAAP